uniref:activating signal cointegrator 1 complex subunit 1-like n=1 Tax=Panthera onca TaxID=9690 RepID=UPI002952E204|nr:activating signal cointegrator 1 complex subunit 1-like [Panthera onca]
MEVLRPQLVRLGGRIYRKNPIQEQTYQHEEEDEDFYQGFVECAEEPCDAYEVVQTQQGFRCTVKAPSLLYKHIVGKRGDTRKKLEVETKTSISIPKPGQEGEIGETWYMCDICNHFCMCMEYCEPNRGV